MAHDKILTAVSAVSDAHYAAIGKVASNWSILELQMNSLIWRLAIVMDQEGACITAQIPNMARRMDAIIALTKLRGGSEALTKDMKKYSEDVMSLQIKRNRFVHDPWMAEADTGVPHRFEVSAWKTLEFEYKAVPTDEVIKFVDTIVGLMDKFEELAKRAMAELDALRRKHLECHLASLPADQT